MWLFIASQPERNEAGQRLRVLPRKRTGHSQHPLPTTQEKTLHMDITRWSTPKSDRLYSMQPKMEKLYTVSKNKTRSWLWLRTWNPIVKFRLKLKKVGKTTRPFRYDLNQSPYNDTVELKNRFKGLDLIQCMMNYGQRFITLYRKQGLRPSTRKRNAKKKNGCLKSYKLLWKEEKQKQMRKGKIYSFECRVPKNSKER